MEWVSISTIFGKYNVPESVSDKSVGIEHSNRNSNRTGGLNRILKNKDSCLLSWAFISSEGLKTRGADGIKPTLRAGEDR